MPAATTGIQFSNTIVETPSNNVMTYEYIYNGGGVAVGDINKDNLPDIYFSGNTVKNKLYLNRGDWKFEDITDKAAIREREDWKTGVTMADVNGDGWLDIYLCFSGNAPREGFNKPVIIDYPKRTNQLFINNGCTKGGVPSFTERAAEFGLDAKGTFSTQAYFFDFDLDGDLDMFLLNHANMFYSVFHNVKKLRSLRHPYFGNKLYRNDNNKFVEVSEEAGIHGSGLNFGLSAALGDFNDDGWPDIYVGNDYDEQDFCYLNNHDGTFTDVSHKAFGHLSKSSMGSDVADINNDRLPDIFVADMLPENNQRLKLLKGPDGYQRYKMAADSGYHHQYMRNMLHINTGVENENIPVFSEVGQMVGISKTDWSWAPLFADFDNDGFKDLFISNGYLRDYTNLDFLQFTLRNRVNEANNNNHPVDLLGLIEEIPITKIRNFVFRNTDGLHFKDMTSEWNLAEKTISNASAYADLDNDGDYDLIINNLNDEVLLYQNHQEKIQKNNFIKVYLEGELPNSAAIGSKIILEFDKDIIFVENYIARGYQSSLEPVKTIGIGNRKLVDVVKVIWPEGSITTLHNVRANQSVVLSHKDAKMHESVKASNKINPLKEITAEIGLSFRHMENNYQDFNTQPFLYYQLSRLGGNLVTGDIDSDGNDDIYFCGAAGQSGELYYGNDNGTFLRSDDQPWNRDRGNEDMDGLFFDADGDGDLDLYVVSGGYEYTFGRIEYADRIYINEGDRKFRNSILIPGTDFSGSCVVSADYDKDGDLDLFIGGRLIPHNFPLIPESTLLRNDSYQGKVVFTNVIDSIDGSSARMGMVTDASWADINNDEWPDLIVVGDWMPIKIFINKEGIFYDNTSHSGLDESEGWWRKIVQGDFDSDGDIDFLIGNAGTNLRLQASKEEPLTYYVNDINNDGIIDPILCYSLVGKSYPLVRRDDFLSQIQTYRKKFVTYQEYADATIDDILKNENIPEGYTMSTKVLSSVYMENNGEGEFNLIELPDQAQVSMINAFIREDFNHNGKKEILAAGNFFMYNAQFGRSDASCGCILDFNGKEFEIDDHVQLRLNGDIRDMEIISSNDGKKRIVVSRNDDEPSIYEY